MTGRPKDPKTARNKNVLVIGGSGSGKTRFYVKPNLMQCFPTSDYPTSFVVTDPKGTLVLETGQMFQRAGYRVKILNTINFSKSMKYNPFVYIHSEKDVLKLVNTLIANTKGEGEKSAEDFWVKSERLFYTALIGYIWYEAPAEEMNFTTLLEMINASEAREDDPDFRKWGGVPTGATQNVKDLLSSPEIENILENSDFITLLNQASGDRKILSERLNLSADQQKYIDNSEPGEGLLIFENVVLPFSNPIPKNTQLYKIMTTRLSEVVEL